MNKYETTLELNVILDKCKEEAFLEVSKQNIIDFHCMKKYVMYYN